MQSTVFIVKDQVDMVSASKPKIFVATFCKMIYTWSMSKEISFDSNQNDAETTSLRCEFGLPALANDPDAPEVDLTLLTAFTNHEPLSPQAIEMVVDYLSKYETWRTEHIRLLIDNYRRQIDIAPTPTADSE